MSQPAEQDLEARILAILDDNRVMTLATVRPDGWPQATLVGFVHDRLTLYFAVGRTSQKLANIARNAQVSIAVGRDSPEGLRGLSMAARVAEVTDLDEIARLNVLIAERYPEQAVFAPRESSAAVLKAVPRLISVVDLATGSGEPQLVEVAQEFHISPVSTAPSPG